MRLLVLGSAILLPPTRLNELLAACDLRFQEHDGELGPWMQDEGLSAMWKRHAEMHDMLWDGLREMKLEPYVQNEQDRLVTVNTIKVCSQFAGIYDAVHAMPQPLKLRHWAKLVIQQEHATLKLSR